MTPQRSRSQTRNRRYDMRERHRLAERTRSNVLAAAVQLLEAHGSGRLTVEEVARAAGINRTTIYDQFGSRPGLLAAVFEDLLRRIRYQHISRIFTFADPLEALSAGLRNLGTAWDSAREPMRRIMALAVIDPDVGEVVRHFDELRRSQMTTLAKRMAHARRPRTGLKAPELVVLLTSFTSFQFFDTLAADSDVQTAIKRLERTVLSAIRG